MPTSIPQFEAYLLMRDIKIEFNAGCLALKCCFKGLNRFYRFNPCKHQPAFGVKEWLRLAPSKLSSEWAGQQARLIKR